MSFGLGAAIVAPVGVALSAIRFTQAIAASESEAAAGLNCPRSFTLTLDFANAQAPAAIDPDAGRPRAAAAATPLILPAAPSGSGVAGPVFDRSLIGLKLARGGHAPVGSFAQGWRRM